MFGRFLRGLPRFLSRRMTFDEARGVIRTRMAAREENFLRTLRLTVFGNPHSPYRPLLAHAGCEPGDLEHLVARDGIESTLRTLRSEGVYVTFEEFKGRQPLVRNGLDIPLAPEAFDNPLHSRAYQIATGGSTGRGRSVTIDLDHMWAGIPDRLISDVVQGFMGVPVAVWFDGLPSHGPNTLLSRVPFDNVPERWFAPIVGTAVQPALKFRLAQAAMLRVARWSGAPLPRSEPVPIDQAATLARWAEDALRRVGRCGIKTSVSHALRVAIAAEQLGIDLTGAVISGGGEPPTPAKVGAITRTGARFVSSYRMQEVGAIGSSCAAPVDANDQHLMLDQVALITTNRQVPGFDLSVDAFHLTSLLPTARKILLNVELDDYGVIETRRCGCPWDELGFHIHVRDIRSFRKLTGEGVSLIGTDMVRILEEVLPQRFGGSPLDYQFMEEEDEHGFTRLSVVVSPTVTVRDEAEVISTVLEAIQARGHGGILTRSIWGTAGTLRVRRMQPVWTNRGKLLPLHLQRRLPKRLPR